MMRLAASTLAALIFASVPAAADVAPDLAEELRAAKYVYVASQRKSGEFGEPAEIWFLWHDGAVWVGTRPTSWRVKRIQAGRPAARIAVGKADGPAFPATGTIVEPEPKAVLDALYAAYADKYPEGWPRFAEAFREGFATGDRVLVRYEPD